MKAKVYIATKLNTDYEFYLIGSFDSYEKAKEAVKKVGASGDVYEVEMNELVMKLLHVC